MTTASSREMSALNLSAVGNLGMAAAGFGFAVLTGSEALLLDGAFSLLGFIMVLFARRVAELVARPDSVRYHFGYDKFEPLMNSVRGLLMLMATLFALGSAAVAIAAGGRDVAPGLALVYCVVAGAICLALSWKQGRAARETASPTLATDAHNWLVDGVITAAVGVVFVGAIFLRGSRWEAALPYLDPGIVLVMGLGLLGIPVRILRQNVSQLLYAAPDDESQREVRRRVEGALEGIELRESKLRMVEVGRSAYVLATLVVEDGEGETSVSALDRVRERVAEGLEGLHPRTFVDVIFTADERWIEGRV